MVSPIEKYHQRQLDIYDFISAHTGTASQLIDILNKASLSYSHSLLSEYDSTLDRANKRTIVKVSTGKAINNRTFQMYLSSVVINPKVTLTNLNTNTPSISVYDTQHMTQHIVSIHLDSISNLAIQSMTDSDIAFEQYTITYTNTINSLDYMIDITIYK